MKLSKKQKAFLTYKTKVECCEGQTYGGKTTIGAIKFILTNRRKDKWKSKQEVALEAQVEAQTTIKVSEADKLADSLFGNEDDPEDETVEEAESIPNV